MSDLLIGLLGAALATNQPVAVSNLLHQQTGLSISVPDPNDPVEREFQKLLALDDATQTEVDRWIQDNQKFQEKGAGIEAATLTARVKQRLAEVRKAYDAFLLRHPNHARAYLAYASFLNDTGDEEAALPHMEKARDLDPKNPAVWNNLANYHGHHGPVRKSFEYYQKAIDLNPAEPVYYQNFATTVYLFRHDATNYFKLDLPQVFEKAMGLYRKALELDPENFLLATDYAQSYYGFKPSPTGDSGRDRDAAEKHFADAMAAWKAAYKLARDDIERQGVLIHFARLQINAGRFDEARYNLGAVTNEMFNATKANLQKKLASEAAKRTNAPAASATPPGS